MVKDEKKGSAGSGVLMNVMEVSMQFSDTDRQQENDADKIFTRMQKRDVRWTVGTEAGGGSNLLKYLREAGADHGYKVWLAPGTDVWYAVQKEFLVKGTWSTLIGPIRLPGEARRNTTKRVTGVEFDSPVGHMTVLGAHYMTKGRPDAKDPEYARWLNVNKMLAKDIGAFCKTQSKGAQLCFYGGDQNIVDKYNDTFLGYAKMTSCWDELQKWPNTGHGNIDVIASTDKDSRVSCVGARVLDDKAFPLATDHFPVEATYSVQPL